MVSVVSALVGALYSFVKCYGVTVADKHYGNELCNYATNREHCEKFSLLLSYLNHLPSDFSTVKPNGHYMYRPVVTICTASGYCMYHQFNIQQFSVMPTWCIYVFCIDLRTNSDYFPTQH